MKWERVSWQVMCDHCLINSHMTAWLANATNIWLVSSNDAVSRTNSPNILYWYIEHTGKSVESATQPVVWPIGRSQMLLFLAENRPSLLMPYVLGEVNELIRMIRRLKPFLNLNRSRLNWQFYLRSVSLFLLKDKNFRFMSYIKCSHIEGCLVWPKWY